MKPTTFWAKPKVFHEKEVVTVTINELSKQRKTLRQALIDGGMFEGFRRLLVKLFPSDAHFIYELLQNAEDAGASEVHFILNADKLEFEHNGDQLFDIEDVESITNIGSSTKADDPTSIGEFGIGFKAIFAYTNTPEIESDGFHFRIHDMIVPDAEGLLPGALGERRTRFVFPFDNPKKPPERAAAEIEKNLRELNENTLMFLSNICKIEYCLPDSKSGFMERRENTGDKNRIEISVKHPADTAPESTHYLRFTKDVDVRDEDDKPKRCRIAVAFGMNESKGEALKIMPLNPSQVSIYFPLVDETSNLRFHLHAPFASTVARNSVRACPASDELRDHLAELVTESMHVIRDNGWLDVEFLATLPNTTDNLSPFYLPIRERLIEEFNRERLTPTKQQNVYAAASGLYRDQSGGELSALIQDEDLATFLKIDNSQPLWVANLPPRKRNERGQFIQDEKAQRQNDRISAFLTMLYISEWTIEDFVEKLNFQSDTIVKWLKGKQDEWHQQLYVLLGDFLLRTPSSPLYIARERKEKLSNLCIIRCNDGKYRIGSECHFLDDMESEFQGEQTQDREFHYVTKGVYSSGQNENQQEKVRAFLEKIGVCEVDETERIKAILNQRYENPDTVIPSKLHEEDMKRFISFVESNPDKAALFNGYNIFNTSGGNWPTSLVFLDLPYLETGLRVYYEGNEYWEFIDEETVDPCFSLDYEDSDIDLKKLGKFAELLGAKTELEVTPISTWNHPKAYEFREQGTGNWRDKTGIDEDYRILGCHILLDNPSIAKSKLIWQAMCSASVMCLKAEFRWNGSPANELHEDVSSLVYDLRKAKWVPQKNDDTISFVRPTDALQTQLPGGFSYDAEQKWLEAIEFGKTAKQRGLENILKQSEQRVQNQRAAEFGFDSADEAKKAAEYFGMRGVSVEESLKKLHVQERRKELLIIDLDDAEEKSYQLRARSVKVTGNTIDQRTVLRIQYTTEDNRTHCQMCSKGMPFKKRNSEEDYFEAVEALGKAYFFKEHEAQYLVLCPECAAKYKEFVKRDKKARDAFYNALKNSDTPHIRVESNGETIYIRFENKHWQDLKTVLHYYENIYNPDESD